MKTWKCHWLLSLLMMLSGGSLLSAPIQILPTPHYFEPMEPALAIKPGSSVTIVLGEASNVDETKLRLAANFLQHDVEEDDPSVHVEIQKSVGSGGSEINIHLWDYRIDSKPPVDLNFLDRQVLTNPAHFGQSYVVRMPDSKSVWIVGSTDEGALLGTMSVLQLLQKKTGGLEIAGAYIRDYPDFRYRAAADWLLMSEINRWALDWGQGIKGYKNVCEKMLDQALRFKINMVVFDGFGWGLKERFAGYGTLMRSLNKYARARGIHLLYGGYGARYALADRGEYAGRAWKNRVAYPDGATYECMGSNMGTCRANEQLNSLKAEEIRKFVATVEPGALYIHHEDVSLDEFAPMWKKRDARCRNRWPSDSLTSSDGAVGALSHLDSDLVQAINSVKNPDGYDASRDCVIVLVSPGYGPDSVSSADWSETLKFWRNYALQLPSFNNILFCFGGSSISYIFPQKYGGRSWIDLFNSLMRSANKQIGAYIFFAGGAGNFYTDYPLTGTPPLNAMFQGAAGMYNFSGDFYEKPMELINAEYTWNVRGAGFSRNPANYGRAMSLYLRYMYGRGEPSELFGPEGLYQRTCELLYGPTAGPIMASYYQESSWVPDTQSQNKAVDKLTGYIHSTYIPRMDNQVYAVPEYWKDLLWDSNTWTKEITSKRYTDAIASLHISLRELHRRLARYWEIRAKLNAKGAQDVQRALNANPRDTSVEGLRFLQTSFRVDQPLLQSLADYHQGMEAYLASPRNEAKSKGSFRKALIEARDSHKLALTAFPDPIDPAGGEVGAIRSYSLRLVQTIQQMPH